MSIPSGAPYHGDDIYCDEIIPGLRPVNKVLETDDVLAFHHTRPFWPVHVIVIPKRHIDSLLTLTPDDDQIIQHMLQTIQQVTNQIIAEHGAAAVHTNLGAYQDSRHLHWHIYSGKPLRSPSATTNN